MKICLKCNKEFPIWVIIGNKRRNLSNRERCLECSPFGKHNTSAVKDTDKRKLNKAIVIIDGSIFKKCRSCLEILSIDSFYKKGVNCKKCSNKLSAIRITKYRKDSIKQLKQSLGGVCQKCGDNNLTHLCFHHVDMSEKESSISSIKNYKGMLKEAKKCQLLCNNCHLELHQGPEKEIIKENFQYPQSYYNAINKLEYLKYLGGRCIKCGYDKRTRPLSFYHRNIDNKDFQLSQVHTKPLDDIIKKELDKCDLLCANCYSEKHFI